MSTAVTLFSATDSTEAIALGVLALLYLFAAGWSIFHALRRGRGRPYWLGCVVLMASGAFAMASAQFETHGASALPQRFVLGLLATTLGIAAATAGCAWQTLARLRRERH